MEPMNTPNLDCMSDEELERYRQVFNLLYCYASTMQSARLARSRGEITYAKGLEHNADIAYKQLPDWAKW